MDLIFFYILMKNKHLHLKAFKEKQNFVLILSFSFLKIKQFFKVAKNHEENAKSFKIPYFCKSTNL